MTDKISEDSQAIVCQTHADSPENRKKKKIELTLDLCAHRLTEQPSETFFRIFRRLLTVGIHQAVHMPIHIDLTLFQGQMIHMKILPPQKQQSVLGVHNDFVGIKGNHIHNPRHLNTAPVKQG